VAKKLISAKDLELVALQELRGLPGCERITLVRVSRISDQRFETNWSLIALTSDREQSDAIRAATARTQEKLRDIYNLFADRRTSPC
jgi:hypothetical protein